MVFVYFLYILIITILIILIFNMYTVKYIESYKDDNLDMEYAIVDLFKRNNVSYLEYITLLDKYKNKYKKMVSLSSFEKLKNKRNLKIDDILSI